MSAVAEVSDNLPAAPVAAPAAPAAGLPALRQVGDPDQRATGRQKTVGMTQKNLAAFKGQQAGEDGLRRS